jgi:membrane protease YdiL (CAAX protease family)
MFLFLAGGILITWFMPRVALACFSQITTMRNALIAIYTEQIVFTIYTAIGCGLVGVFSENTIRFSVCRTTMLCLGRALLVVWFVGLAWNLFLEKICHVALEPQWILVAFSQEPSIVIRLLFVFFSVVLGPVAEELFFRAILYRWLKLYIPSWGALVLSSFVFALLHFNWTAFLPLWALGGFLCYTYEVTGALRGAIAFHSLFNANTLLLLALGVF